MNITTDKNKKLNGGGNFTDYNYERHKKYLKTNLNLVVSGFINGDLIYVIEFPFKSLQKHLKSKLDKTFKGKRPKGLFLRSASFSFLHYKNSKSITVHYVSYDKIKLYNQFIAKNFQKWLEEKTKNPK